MSRSPVFRRPTGRPAPRRFFPGPPDPTAVLPGSIPSISTVGVPSVQTGVAPTSIASLSTVGTPTVKITVDLSTLRRPPRRSEGYELVCVARIPQPSGPPTLVEIDAIACDGLSWTDELSRPQALQARAPISTLTDAVVSRLLDLRRNPCEFHLYREGERVFAGPLLTWDTKDGTMIFNAVGLLGYLRYWTIDTDQVFVQVDQFTIVKTLVDSWQNSSYGNYGLVTAIVGVSLVLTDATYKRNENHNMGQRIEELGKRDAGFDISVDPTTRQLQLWCPRQGTDRSTGPGAVVFDGLSITSTDIASSVAPGDVASDAAGSGTGTEPEPLWGIAFDADVRATFGRSAVTASFEVSDSLTLLAHLQGLLAPRTEALLVPGPRLRVPPDVPLSAYGVGDTVAYSLHDRLGVEGAFRIRKRTVSVAAGGTETVTVEFA